MKGGEIPIVRRTTQDGVDWSYVVNTTGEPRTVEVDLPSVSHDVVTGQAIGGHVMVSLAPWELRSFKSNRSVCASSSGTGILPVRRWHGRLTPDPERARRPFHSVNRLAVPYPKH